MVQTNYGMGPKLKRFQRYGHPKEKTRKVVAGVAGVAGGVSAVLGLSRISINTVCKPIENIAIPAELQQFFVQPDVEVSANSPALCLILIFGGLSLAALATLLWPAQNSQTIQQ